MDLLRSVFNNPQNLKAPTGLAGRSVEQLCSCLVVVDLAEGGMMVGLRCRSLMDLRSDCLVGVSGFAFRGHDKNELSLNKGNFLEVLSWYAARYDAINSMTSHDIQKDIATTCKIETVKAIIEDINNDYFALLVDESRDVSRKEKMAICLRYVDKRGFVMEAFIGLVHIKDTSALSLKEEIVDVLAHHSLTLSNVHGQCYDGATIMQGEESQMILMFHYRKRSKILQNAMILVKVAKRRLQALRDNEWDPLFKNIGGDSLKEKVQAFCINHGISLPNFDDPYDNSGRSGRKVVICTTLNHYRVDVFYKIIDWQLQKLNDHFNEVTSDLLNGVSCLNPLDSFSSFDIKKIMRIVELYLDN
ncbi:uncharacterized protein [Solanum tuberosum]|uniref:uncharacterized protein n=1 Tax=Solanum tuberosum TaxID=4113 RepID=UPI000739FF8F|nr:PREDICTED: uncharacterized protein LOC107061487 [Solanum tuberosum]